jgi:predicted DNA-binding mobile mystery protein A
MIALARRQIDRQLDRWKQLPAVPKEGWIRAIRTALGMPATALAKKLQISPSVMTRLERSERDGTISLDSLRKIANALDSEVVYAIVPRRSLDEFLAERAHGEASRRYRRVTHTMALEEQRVNEDETRAQTDELATRLAANADRRLWNQFGDQ